MTDTHVDRPYAEQTSKELARKGAKNFKPAESADGIVLTGKCPVCEAVMEIRLFDEVVRGWFPRPSRSAPPVPERSSVPMICTCEYDHADRPANRKGCGAYWNLDLVTESVDGSAQA
jgi:hypothetical protein